MKRRKTTSRNKTWSKSDRLGRAIKASEVTLKEERDLVVVHEEGVV